MNRALNRPMITLSIMLATIMSCSEVSWFGAARRRPQFGLIAGEHSRRSAE